MKKEKIRSPLFYVGDKYKIIAEIKTYFPSTIDRFIEPFVGGGSVFMNIKARKYFLNDIDKKVIALHKFLSSQSIEKKKFFDNIFSIIDKYGLSCSFKRDEIPIELKKQYPKTYFAHFNKDNFGLIKADYNSDKENIALLYVLLIYGFNRMLRFKSKGDYNLPVGNVDFNNNTFIALNSYFDIVRDKKIVWTSYDYKDILNDFNYQKDDFLYLDPPYLITFSEYNKLWNDKKEIELLKILDQLNLKGVKFAISNVTHYKGRENEIFTNWSKKYNSHSIKSNYISYHDNSNKIFNEVLITNY